MDDSSGHLWKNITGKGITRGDVTARTSVRKWRESEKESGLGQMGAAGDDVDSFCLRLRNPQKVQNGTKESQAERHVFKAYFFQLCGYMSIVAMCT